MHYRQLHDDLDRVLVRLDAISIADIELRIAPSADTDIPSYRAQCGTRWTYVDRKLARTLRENGAVWRGDVRQDPCPVA